MVSEKDFNDPDLFLRGKAVKNGIGTFIKTLHKYTARDEAELVFEAVREAHDIHKIPYDEIAVVTYNGTYKRKMKDWDGKGYNIRRNVLMRLMDENIPRCEMYSDCHDVVQYGSNDGVAMISFDSVLGLDFRAVIVCGLKPLGDYDGTKYITTESLEMAELDDETRDNIRKNISLLYVACTRARELLYIIQPEKKVEESLYMNLIVNSMKEDE